MSIETNTASSELYTITLIAKDLDGNEITRLSYSGYYGDTFILPKGQYPAIADSLSSNLSFEKTYLVNPNEETLNYTVNFWSESNDYWEDVNENKYSGESEYIITGNDTLFCLTRSRSFSWEYVLEREYFPTPIRDGYEFLGWYYDERYSDDITYGPCGLNKDKELSELEGIVTDHMVIGITQLYTKWKPLTKGLSIKINGAWKTGPTYIKANGEWKPASNIYYKVNNTWKSM